MNPRWKRCKACRLHWLRQSVRQRVTSSEARESLTELLHTCPIGNFSTVHESILCAGAGPHLVSSPSPCQQLFEKADGPLMYCTNPSCNQPTWYAVEMAGYVRAVDRAERVEERRARSPSRRKSQARADTRTSASNAPTRTRPTLPPACYNGSLEKRRGSLYFCEEHCLRVDECTVREAP